VVKTDYTYFQDSHKETLKEYNVGIFSNKNKVALLNGKGEELVAFANNKNIEYRIWGFNYSDISVITKTTNSNQNSQMLYGAINNKGEMVIDFIYKGIGSFSREGYASFQTEENGKYGLIDKTGKIIVPTEMDRSNELPDFSTNGLAVKKDKNENGIISYGYINTNGEWAIKPQFEAASNFQDNGLATVRLENGYGVINQDGKVLTKNEYKTIEGYKNGVAIIYTDENKYGLINQEGKEIASGYEKLEVISEQFIEAKKDGLVGILTLDGKTYLECKFEDVGKVGANGLIAAKQDAKWGYVDKSGNFKIEPTYSKAETFKANGYAVVAKSGRYGIINEKDEIIIETEYKDAVNFNVNGIAALKVDRSWKFVNVGKEEIAKIDTEALWYYLGDGYYMTQTLKGDSYSILKDGTTIMKNIKAVAVNTNLNK